MKQQLIAWLNERLAHEENTFCHTDLLTTSRKAAKMDELRAIIEYVKGTDNSPQTFDEVLKKHFGESAAVSYDGDFWKEISFFNFKTEVDLFAKSEHLKSFTSPEKLDQFLTLLFGEEP